MAAPVPLTAGPAGFPPTVFTSPGCAEMRVVFGEQPDAAPMQVSRTRTWRTPLLICPAVAFVVEDFTERKAMNRPDELMDGSKLSVALNNPLGSTETSCVCGLQPDAAPWQVSRRKICLPFGVSAARFVA